MIDWKEVEVRIMDCQLPVDLRIDEYDVTLIRTREKNSLYTVIFINGKINFEWCTKDCDIRKRFMCPQKKCLVSQKELSGIRSKKKRQEVKERATYTYYTPYWSSFSRLRIHLIENNKSIEIKKNEEEEQF